ncbi:nucleotidyltransferase family protein [Priestia koreensis]|uniref:nucleotidyltransferase family protein n=1 Tax=Priestia koreensis TaxID=284581 RepID=UPI003CFF651E
MSNKTLFPAVMVLAAGLSSRMKVTKQTLPFGNSTILEHVLTTVLNSNYRPVILVLGHHYKLILDTLSPWIISQLKVVINENYKEGLSSSIKKGLNEIPAERPCLVLLGDQPFITNEWLDHIHDIYTLHPSVSVRTEWKDQIGPPILLSPHMITNSSLLEGDQGFKGLFKQTNKVINCIPRTSNMVMDVDTDDDYKSALEVLAKEGYNGYATVEG